MRAKECKQLASYEPTKKKKKKRERAEILLCVNLAYEAVETIHNSEKQKGGKFEWSEKSSKQQISGTKAKTRPSHQVT